MIAFVNADNSILADWSDRVFALAYLDPPFFSGRDFGEFGDQWHFLGGNHENRDNPHPKPRTILPDGACEQ